MRVLIGLCLLIVLFLGATTAVLLVKTKMVADQSTQPQLVVTNAEPVPVPEEHPQFPIGVDPLNKVITENPVVDVYFLNQISSKTDPGTSHTSWFGKVLGKLALSNWYQNLASLTTRILIIQSGERKEEVAQHFGKILGWNEDMKKEFLDAISTSEPILTDGKFFPGTYVVARGATPAEVAPLIIERFDTEIVSRYGSEVAEIIPLNDTLTIASLLEREAYDFDDMRQISGVIWNRLFTDMNLQIDATLQYAKGSKPSEPWWPTVRPSDKYISSPFNTYKNEGLPPSPIANASLDAVLAALNPKKTDCMYYFHDKNAGFHCSPTYKEHVELLKKYYGRGK